MGIWEKERTSDWGDWREGCGVKWGREACQNSTGVNIHWLKESKLWARFQFPPWHLVLKPRKSKDSLVLSVSLEYLCIDLVFLLLPADSWLVSRIAVTVCENYMMQNKYCIYLMEWHHLAGDPGHHYVQKSLHLPLELTEHFAKLSNCYSHFKSKHLRVKFKILNFTANRNTLDLLAPFNYFNLGRCQILNLLCLLGCCSAMLKSPRKVMILIVSFGVNCSDGPGQDIPCQPQHLICSIE